MSNVELRLGFVVVQLPGSAAEVAGLAGAMTGTFGASLADRVRRVTNIFGGVHLALPFTHTL
jgi:hypothetical protein